MSLVDLIDLVVAMGVPISYIQDKNRIVDEARDDDYNPINGCKAAKDLLERLQNGSSGPFTIRIGCLIFWSDGF